MYKVVISDLDGTLLNPQHQISARTCATLHQLTAQGVKFVVATGRHHVDARGIRATLGLDISLITSNGAVVHDKDDQLLFTRTLPNDIASELIRFGRRPNVHINVYQGDEWLVEQELPWLLDYHNESGFTYRALPDLAEAALREVTKVFFVGEHADLWPMEEAIKQRFGAAVNVTFSTPDCLEVMHCDVHKGHAVEKLLATYGLDLSQAVAFGDGMNDVEMLSMVGRGVVMANAHDRLKN
ncbi:MAG: Cof-type HAD-IIB family hydrolase, partial [Aeromonas sp.]